MAVHMLCMTDLNTCICNDTTGMNHQGLSLLAAVTRKTNGRSLGTFQKVGFFRKWDMVGWKLMKCNDNNSGPYTVCIFSAVHSLCMQSSWKCFSTRYSVSAFRRLTVFEHGRCASRCQSGRSISNTLTFEMVADANPRCLPVWQAGYQRGARTDGRLTLHTPLPSPVIFLPPY